MKQEIDITPIGILLIITYLTIIGFGFWLYSQKKFKDDIDKEKKKFFMGAFYYKIFVGIGFALIYSFYYKGVGDTFFYFKNSCRLSDLLFSDTKAYFMFMFDQINRYNIFELGVLNYYPPKDPAIFAVHRFLSFFTILGLKNYYLSSICLNTFLFILNWRVCQYFTKIFTKYEKIIMLCILFIPSVTFWNSGLVKDAFTFSFSLLFLVYFHKIVFERKIGIFNIFKIIFCAYILISLKPYILFALMISGFIWLGFNYIRKIKNRVIKVFVLPFIIFSVSFVGLRILSAVMDIAGGAYADVEGLLNKASITQYDLKQDYYEGAAFDIGDFDPTIAGAMSVAPKAVIAGLYRPFIWEARSIVMILSGLENSVFLIFSILIIIRVGIIKFLKQLQNDPFLIFCITFTIALALGVGISTSNFGALVRFKIPMMPFFFMFLLIIFKNHRNEKKETEDGID